MPRIKPLTKVSSMTLLSGLLKIHIDDQLGGVPAAADAMAMSAGTLYNRLKSPEDLTIGELMQLRKITGIDKDLLMQTLGKII